MRYIILILLSLLAGCAGNRIDPNFTAQLEAYKATVSGQKPLLEIKAAPGSQEIRMSGIESLTVWAPSQGASNLPSYRPRESGWLSIAKTLLGSTAPALAQVWAGVKSAQYSRDTTLGTINALTDAQVSIAGDFGGLLGQGLGIIGSQPPTTSVSGDYYAVGGNWTDSSGSTTVGGDLIGGDRVDSSGSVSVGGDQFGGDWTNNAGRVAVGGDQTGGDVIGRDVIGGDRVDNSGRIGSDGPIDNSSNDSSDNSNNDSSDNSNSGG